MANAAADDDGWGASVDDGAYDSTDFRAAAPADASTVRDDAELGQLAGLGMGLAGQFGGRFAAAGQRELARYGKIDLLRPYFAVDTTTVRKRLAHSIAPFYPSGNDLGEAGNFDLYGPLMSVLTLGSLIVFGMRLGGEGARKGESGLASGAVMGMALGVCFSYWIMASALFLGIARMSETKLDALNIVALTGYGFFGVSLALLLAIVLPFWAGIEDLLIVVLGGLSSAALGRVFSERTEKVAKKFGVGVAVACIHMSFVAYLRLAYVRVV